MPVFETADVCLGDTSHFRQLLLRQRLFIAPFQNRSHDLTLRFEGIPLGFECGISELFIQSFTKILAHRSILLPLLVVRSIMSV